MHDDRLGGELLGGAHAALEFQDRVSTPDPLRDQQAWRVHRQHGHLVPLGELLHGVDVLTDRFGPHHQFDAVVTQPGRILESGLGP